MPVPGSIVVPPTANPDDNSFTLAVEYLEENLGQTVIMKKVWSHTDGGLILSLFSKKPAFVGEEEIIDRIFSSIEVAPPSSSYNGDVQSYIAAMGVLPITLQKNGAAQQQKQKPAPVIEEEPPIVNTKILVFGAVLAVLAGLTVVFQKKSSSEEAT